MAMSVTYATVNGQLVYEDRGGVETYYLNDPLGSVVQCHDATGAKTYEAWYWPYGEVRVATGSNPGPWGFVGSLGYYTDDNSHIYVRARIYRPDLARWQTVDPIWPWQYAYAYGNTRPSDLTDESGLVGQIIVGIIIGAVAGCAISTIVGAISQLFNPTPDPNAGCKRGFDCISGALQGVGGSLTIGTLGAGAAIGCLFGALAGAVSAYGNRYCDCHHNPCCPPNNPDFFCNLAANAVAGCFGGGLIGEAGEGVPIGPPSKSNTTIIGGLIGGLIGLIANRLGAVCTTFFE